MNAPYAVATGARLAGRTGGHLWCTADNTTFDHLETFASTAPVVWRWIATRARLATRVELGVSARQAGPSRRATMGFYSATGVINGYDGARS